MGSGCCNPRCSSRFVIHVAIRVANHVAIHDAIHVAIHVSWGISMGPAYVSTVATVILFFGRVVHHLFRAIRRSARQFVFSIWSFGGLVIWSFCRLVMRWFGYFVAWSFDVSFVAKT